MGYTELGRKRPIELQIDYYDKILVYQHQGEIWGVCYKHGEIVTKIIKPLKRNNPGLYSINEIVFSRVLEVIK